MEHPHKKLREMLVAEHDCAGYGPDHICVKVVAFAELPSRFGDFHVVAFSDTRDGKEHAAFVKGMPWHHSDVPVRLHSECLTGDAIGSLRCDCRDQLEAAHVLLHLFQAFIPAVVASGWGRVIIVSSPVAVSPTGKTGAYAAAKAAQEAMLLTLAQETQSQNVTANLLQVRAIGARQTGDTTPSPTNGAAATPEEIVAAMLYLCSDEAALVTGARLPLTGAGS